MYPNQYYQANENHQPYQTQHHFQNQAPYQNQQFFQRQQSNQTQPYFQRQEPSQNQHYFQNQHQHQNQQYYQRQQPDQTQQHVQSQHQHQNQHQIQQQFQSQQPNRDQQYFSNQQHTQNQNFFQHQQSYPNQAPYVNQATSYPQPQSNSNSSPRNDETFSPPSPPVTPISTPQFKDYGPHPFVVNIEAATHLNNSFRTTLWTGTHLQLTLMSINVGEDIGLETHPNLDQFIRIEEGQALMMMGDTKDTLDFQKNVEKDFAFIIPAGKWYNLINTGSTPLKLYSIYAPVQHPFGTFHATKADALASE